MVLNLLRKNCLGRKRLFQSIIHEVPTCGFYTSRYDIESYRMLGEVHAMFLEMYLIFAGKLQQLYQSPYTTVYKWRLKSYFVFPLRYFLDEKRVKIEYLLCRLKNLLYVSKSTLHDKPKESPGKGNDKLVFPPEIWLQIAKYDADAITLMSVNQALLHIFAYLVYSQVHGILVISSLDKMKASDQCFVRNGPDLENSGLDEYGIYVRSKESKNFTHEAIDIAFNGEEENIYARIPHFEGLKIDMKGRKEYPSAIVSLDSVKSPTIVSSYSGLRCIITEIIKNPNSIMNKYIRKFSIDVMVLSDIDKFRQDFDKAIGCPVDELKCYKIKNEDTRMMVPLFSGFEEFSDLRIAMRPNITSDLVNEGGRQIEAEVSRRFLKKIFETVYCKELISVVRVFQSLFVPLPYYNRKKFNYRNSTETYSTNFMYTEPPLYSREFNARERWNMLSGDSETRCDTLFLASTVRIKDRAFLAQEEINEFCELLAELSTIKERTQYQKNYSFLLHGVTYTHHEEKFAAGPEVYHEGPGRYLTNCFASPKCIILTNTCPDGSSKDPLNHETDISIFVSWDELIG